MLRVYVGKQFAGSLFKSEVDYNKYGFSYNEQCPYQNAVSLSMPVVNDQYSSDYRLHPIFDMNLPEGALGDRLRKQFSKVLPNFDDLALLEIVGKSQIGRLRFIASGEEITDVPTQDLSELLIHDGADGLFESLLSRYAVYSGISGAQPKVMVRDSGHVSEGRVTHRGATHIVKAWNADEFPQLAANEYFCMRAALHAKLEVPNFELSEGGKFLIVERFDLKNDTYLGFEDFCVLNGKSSDRKYEGSYENIAKRIKDFVSPDQVRPALESFFKALVLSCAIKNGDAHLKNFGVLYNDTESTVCLSPIYDLVSTTPYNSTDILALTLGGTKRWPKAKALVAFARAHCDISDARTRELMAEVVEGVLRATDEAVNYIQNNDFFKEVGEVMLVEWGKGLNLSINL
ncbi:type II toxin-antitoxin system HipA family toxin [Methylobacter svalbardensis]|uniref:type II toxin-antitoxin system HipA family toxin n=1 Tax=Methylobacter svalbardensis TaxID=3080016 RepID=UPI0030EB4EBC